MLRIAKENKKDMHDVESIPKYVKQQVLDLMHEGKSLEEVSREVNLDIDIVAEIIIQNVEVVSFLRRRAE